jgi:carboxyl-terminal processing protease
MSSDHPKETPQAPLSPSSSPSRKKLFVGAILFLLVGYGLGFTSGYKEYATEHPKFLGLDAAHFINTDNQDLTIDFSLFWKVWKLLQEKYVDANSLDAHTLFYGAINGMLEATGDPYTTFFSPEEQKSFQEELSGTFEGIGAEMGMRDGLLTIVAPLEGMPAAQAGLRPGDRILKIDGVSTETLSLEEAVNKIRGPKGTEVKLTVYTDQDEAPREVAVQRAVISVKSVRYEKKDHGVAYIRLIRFGDDTVKEFGQAVHQAKQDGATGVLLDVRSNPGGLLDGAVEIASYFLPKGKLVVSEVNSQGQRSELAVRSTPPENFREAPVVILIDQGSASAAEILAGALREQRANVVLVGKKTFGKGSVQELIPVTRDTSVKITVAKWLTPQGHQINNTGIEPDEETEFTREQSNKNEDPQYDQGMKRLLELMGVEQTS